MHAVDCSGFALLFGADFEYSSTETWDSKDASGLEPGSFVIVYQTFRMKLCVVFRSDKHQNWLWFQNCEALLKMPLWATAFGS